MPEASNAVNPISLNVPDLSPSRTRMNQTHLLSSNWLFKTGQDADLRFQVSGVFDEIQVAEEVVTEYTDIATDNRIAEYSQARSHSNFANGELLYRVNSDRFYLTNNLSTHLSFDREQVQHSSTGNCKTSMSSRTGASFRTNWRW